MARPSWIGQTIGGRYRIEDLLGKGGMSAVYKATDPNLRRVVAVKLIHSHLTDDESFVRRFEEEAATVAQLRHPNIIQVFDFNHDEGTYYIIFEFLPGETLQSRIKRLSQSNRPMDLQEVVKITAGIADALDYAHKRNLVHRDVKPANVMINVHGQPILMDFGIVKIVGGTQHTATGATIGTARYMSPEQIRSTNIDGRTDIYSLGVMLYEMVGGQAPYESDSAMTVMMMHVSDPVPDVRSLRPGVPPALLTIINRAMSKDPNQRFRTAGEMAAALRSADLSAPPVQADATVIQPVADATVIQPLTGPGAQYQPPTGNQPRPISAQQPQPVTGQQAQPVTGPQPVASTGSSTNFQAPQQPKSRLSPALIGGGIVTVIILLACIVGAALIVPDLLDPEDATPIAEVTDTPEPDDDEEPDDPDDEDEEDEPDDMPPPTPIYPPVPPPPADLSNQAAYDEYVQMLENHANEVRRIWDMYLEDLEEFDAQAAEEARRMAPTAVPSVPPPEIPTDTPEPTATLEPTATPTLEPTPFPEPFVFIIDIGVNGSGQYVVAYETYGYVEALPGMHIHFFFDTVDPEQAGVPGAGPWAVYGGPRPYENTQLAVPAGATQMCALVANSNHTIVPESGNCVDLPE